MKNIACLLALSFSFGAPRILLAESQHKLRGMPEPSAIPELAVGMAGLSFVAWRRWKR